MTTVVIGGGIVGLHAAGALKAKGHEVWVLERESFFAEHTSGRNSGVIHAGIFYPEGSLKEKTCIEGNRLTYEWVERLHVPHRRSGKWVVPEEGQEPGLEPFFEKIRKLPIPPPERVSQTEFAKREPALRASEAIFVPSTGIVDAASYVKGLGAHLEREGVTVITNCRVLEVQSNTLVTTRGEINFDRCVNASGLNADEIACRAGLTEYSIKPCRGDYYLLNRQPISRPVYHLPYHGAQGLGIHLTPTLDGQTLLGPNAFFIEEKEDYRHRSAPEPYEKAVRFYLPGLKEFKITEGYAGNRPKLYRKDLQVADFVIEKQGNWIHLLGIESPGLTAAPALAKLVADQT